jgi:hypothetical protein
MVRSWSVYDQSLGSPWSVYSQSMISPWSVCDQSMISQWSVRNQSKPKQGNEEIIMTIWAHGRGNLLECMAHDTGPVEKLVGSISFSKSLGEKTADPSTMTCGKRRNSEAMLQVWHIEQSCKIRNKHCLRTGFSLDLCLYFEHQVSNITRSVIDIRWNSEMLKSRYISDWAKFQNCCTVHIS